MSKSTEGLINHLTAPSSLSSLFSTTTTTTTTTTNNNNNQMPGRGPSARLAIPDAIDRVFSAGDAVAEAKEARARAREALARAEEAVWRAVYRQSVERAALEALQRNLGG
jgi:hypothetical protein